MIQNEAAFLLAAALASRREKSLPLDPIQVEPGALISILAKNKVPLGWLGQRANQKHPFLQSAEFTKAREEEHIRLESQRSAYRGVLDSFASAGVSGVLIKPVDLRPAFPVTGDNLDLFIQPGRMGVARNLLRAGGFVEIRHVEERGKYLFRRFRGGEEALALHLHEDVAWDGVVFVDRESLWEGRRFSSVDDLVTLPSLEDSVLVNLAHAFYENKQIKLSDLLKVEFCLQAQALDWDYLWWMARKRGWLFGLHTSLLIANHLYRLLLGEDLLESPILRESESNLRQRGPLGDWVRQKTCQPRPALPYPISFSLSKAYWYAKMLGDRDLRWRDKSTDLFLTSLRGFQRKFQKGKRSQPSMLVSLSGIDGSGKTAQAEALIKALTTAEVKTSYVWVRGSSSLPTRVVKDWLAPVVCRGERGEQVLPVEKRRRARLITNPVLRAVYPYLTFLDLLWQYTIKVRFPLLRGQVVVADRYVYDAIADLGADLGKGKVQELLASRLLRLGSPAADVAYLLDVPAQLGYQRKEDETSLEEVERRSELYRAMAANLGLVVVDAARDFAEVNDEIVHDALQRYCDNHWTLVNALFRSNPSRLGVEIAY